MLGDWLYRVQNSHVCPGFVLGCYFFQRVVEVVRNVSKATNRVTELATGDQGRVVEAPVKHKLPGI